jgi:F-type H+-transporting ATPase subunit b
MGELFATFGVNWKLLLIQAVNFGLLLAALRYFLYGPILKVIDERKAKISEGVENAAAAARKLETAETEKESIIKTANTEAEKIVAESKGYATEKGKEIVKEAEVESEAILADARARAEEAQRKALAESEAEVARLAILGAEKILHEKLN